NGYGNEGAGPGCGFVNSEQNEYLAYGALAARALAADHTTIAWSGKSSYEMLEYFERTLPARNDSKWDFTSYQPHVVVVNVGTNDFANVDPGEALWVRVYVKLIERIRAVYPQAVIVCAISSMLTDVFPEGRNARTKAKKYMATAFGKLHANDANV